MADQDSSPPPPPTSTSSGSGEPVNGRPPSSAAAGTNPASSSPRYRYSDPFPINVRDQTVTVTGRLLFREPPPSAGQRQPLLLFMEIEDRQRSSQLQGLRNIVDGSLMPVIFHRHHIEQLWMEVQELAEPNQQASTSYGSGERPSFANIPTPPFAINIGTHRFRLGEPFPINVRNPRVIVTGQEVHLEPPPTAPNSSSAGRRQPSLLYVEVVEPISETLQIESNGVRLVIFGRIRMERLLLEARRDLNQNRSDQPPTAMNPMAARGTNVGPSNRTNNGSENLNGSQRVNARAGNSGVGNIVQAEEQQGPLISNRTTATGDHPSTSNQNNNENASLTFDLNQPMDGDDDPPAENN